MADENIISSTAPEIITQVQGEIAAAGGSVFILRSTGEVVPAESGVELYLNDTITSHDDSSVFMLFGDQTALTLGQAQKLVITEEFLAGTEQAVEYDVYERNEITQDELAQAIAEGRNIEELLEATAAGEEALPGAGTESFIIYQRTGDALIPVSGFETSTFTTAVEFAENQSGQDAIVGDTEILPVVDVVEPIATQTLADTNITTEDTALNVSAAEGVLANDSDADDDLSVASFTVAGDATVYAAGDTVDIDGVGSLQLNSDGSYNFTPAADYTGDVPVVTYTTNTGAQDSLTINITPVDDPTIAQDDSGVVQVDTPLVVDVASGVLANDSDPDSDLTVASFSIDGVDGSFNAGDTANIPGVGTLQLNEDGSYTFTPEPGYSGNVPDTTYTTNTGFEATLVLSVAEAPTVTASDSNTTTEDTALNVSAAEGVLANDSDADDDLSVASFTVAGDATEYTAGDTAEIDGVGSLQLNSDGSYNFTPVAHYAGDVPVVTYTTNTGAQDSLTINVTPENDAPIVSNNSITVAEDSNDTGLGLTAPTDADNDALVITVTGLPTLGQVTLVNGERVDNGQRLSPEELEGLQYDAPADYDGVADPGDFTYSVSDGTVTENGSVDIGITPENDAPIVSNNSITVAEDSNDTGLGLTAPTDADTDELVITVTGLPTLGQVTLANGDPVINGQTLTPAELEGLQYDAPADYDGVADPGDFTYSVSDGDVTENGSVDIGITPENDAPIVSNNSITVAEDSNDTGLGLTAPTDADNDALVITVTGLPTLGQVTLANGDPVINGQRLSPAELEGLQYDAPADYDGVADPGDFAYSVSDGTVTENGSVDIGITPENDAPVATNSALVIDEDSGPVALNIPAPTDSDTDVSSLVVTITSLPAEGIVTLDGDEITENTQLTVEQLQSLSFEAPENFSTQSDSPLGLTYTVDDGESAPVEATVAITVEPIADLPTVTIDSSQPDSADLPESTGLVFSFYEDLNHSNRDASSIEEAQANAEPTSVERQFVGFGDGDVVATSQSTLAAAAGDSIEVAEGNSYSITGLIYLEAGQTYDIAGYADDSFRVELGGSTLLSTTGNSWGNFGYSEPVPLDQIEGEQSFTAPASGYYTLEVYANNVTGPGQFSLYVSENGGEPQLLSAENFNLQGSAQDIIDGGGQFGAFEPSADNTDGGYFPVGLNTGIENSPVSLSNITATLQDNDGSESITAIDIGNIPVGATLTDGNNTFIATAANQSVNIESWDLENLQLTATAGEYALTVTATAEDANGDTATSAPETIDVTVLENNASGAFGGVDSDIANNNGVDFGESQVITGSDTADNLAGNAGNDALYGEGGNDSLDGGAGEDFVNGGAGNDTLLGGEDADIVFGGAGNDQITGGTGNDRLTGGEGSDTFIWTPGDDEGFANTVDTITDFQVGEGGDVLDLSDLLVNENEGNLEDYLTSINYDAEADRSEMTINTDGGGPSDNITIRFEGVDLTQAGLLDQAAIINDLLANGNLNVDNP